MDDTGLTDGWLYQLFNEQLLLIATVLGAVAALPTLIEFMVERRKRAERIGLSLEDEGVDELQVRLAGLDELCAATADIVDAARHPAEYRGSSIGNELLVIGPSMSGKKSFARWIAKEARFDRVITVHNPRNGDALSGAKALLQYYRRQKVMLLLPNIDRVLLDTDDDDLLSEMDALISSSSERENVLVVGTATQFAPNTELDNIFGVKILLPGTRQDPEAGRDVEPDAMRMLRKVAEYYLDLAEGKAGCTLVGFDREALIERVLAEVGNPAEVEDIINLCKTAAVYRLRTGRATRIEITPDVLEAAIRRVIVTGIVR